MRLLLLLTSHNSLSQRLTTILDELSPDQVKGPKHDLSGSITSLAYTIEYALSEELMLQAVERVKPDIIVGAFLTKKVPKAIWSKYMTLILHPGPPGDAGPSAIDWALMGDSGAFEDASEALEKECLDGEAFQNHLSTKRKVWGVTCLQAEEEFDQGPIWAFETFAIPPEATKSALYRGPVTQAACLCIVTALTRIQKAKSLASYEGGNYSPTLTPPPDSALVTVTGKANEIVDPRHRPLLKSSQRAADPTVHTAAHLAAIVRAGDSQPGVQVTWLDYDNRKKPLFLHGAWVENGTLPGGLQWEEFDIGQIVAIREGAILIKTRPDPTTPEDRGVWITHARSPMSKETKILPAKLPATDALKRAGLEKHLHGVTEWSLRTWDKVNGVNGRKTWQQVWVEIVPLGSPEGGKSLHIHFDFYNGACSTHQCELLLDAITESVQSDPDIRVLCLMGSRNYFSNGIALNVIEASSDPAKESWKNINAIDDVVEYVLGDSSPYAQTHSTPFMKGRKTLTDRGILTISAIQSNAAAGGLALATCCDIVLCSANAVLNPHYRSVGLFGSEFHRYHWVQRAGLEASDEMMRKMLPIGPEQARQMGLVDKVIGDRTSSPDDIELAIKLYVDGLARARVGEKSKFSSAPWLKDTSTRAVSPVNSLLEHLARNKREHHASLPFPLIAYRNEELSQMLLDFYHPVRSPRYHQRRQAFVGKHVSKSTPLRFAEHNRGGCGQEWDIEEQAAFDDAPGWTRGEEWRWAGDMIPDGFLTFKPFEAGLLTKKKGDDVVTKDDGMEIKVELERTVKIATRSDTRPSHSDSDQGKPSTDSTRSGFHEKTTQITRPGILAPGLTATQPLSASNGTHAKRSSVDFKATFKRAMSMATRIKSSPGPDHLDKEQEPDSRKSFQYTGRPSDLANVRESDKPVGSDQLGRLVQEHQLAGVNFTQPDRVYLEPTVKIARGVKVGIDVQLWGHTDIGEGVIIDGPAVLIDTKVDAHAHIRPFSHLQSSHVGAEAIIGPYARLREGTFIGDRSRIGNFVEIKNAQLGVGVKANHLAFIGQATIGAGTNLGAGTITCNCDGYSKHRTVIGENAFIGSNSTLVAPLTLGDDALIAAGSTITRSAPSGSLVFGRARQTVLEGRAQAMRRKLAMRDEEGSTGKEAQPILFPCYYSVTQDAPRQS